MVEGSAKSKGQIALEFLIVYSFVLVVFILIFSIVTTQRAVSIRQQEYSLLQLQTQNIASYIDQAVSAGNGYVVTVPLVTGIVPTYYNLSISSTGVIIAQTKTGSQPITTYAFSNAKSIVVNGTQALSGNGISVYQIQTAKGSIIIYNSKGIIYINQLPTNIGALPGSAIVTQVANVKAVTFNDLQSSFIKVPANSVILRNVFSITFWFDNNAARKGCDSLVGMPSSTQLLIYEDYVSDSCLSPGYYPINNHLVFKYIDSAGGTIDGQDSGAFSSDTWTYAVATFNGISGNLIWYINGMKSSSYNSLPAMSQDSNALNIGMGDTLLNGSVSNLQIYNGILTANQVLNNYNKGLAGTPANLSLLGWWPLNGNPNDYSGNNNQGVPQNGLQYQSVVQVNAKVLTNGGSASSNSPVGFVSSKGFMSYAGNSISVFTNGNGIAAGFVSSNNAYGSANVGIDIFNGNQSTTANLIGWWPIDTGYGNVVYDLSQNYDNGKFSPYTNSPPWSPSPNVTEFTAAGFPGNPLGLINSNTQDGFIAINSSQSLLGIVANNSFTSVMWIYFRGSNSNHNQGLFGNLNTCSPGNYGAGFQLLASASLPGFLCASNNPLLIINNSYVPFPNGLSSLPTNRWEMITAEYNGSTGLASVYINNTLFTSNVLPKNLGLLQLSPYYLGADAWQSTGDDTFNGLMTNVQFYSKYLTQQQISALYRQGIGSNPLGNSGMISWWPLVNNTKDYSYNNNTGFINYNVSFSNSNYQNEVASQGQTSYANLNGSNCYNITVPYSQALGATAGKFSVNLWFNSQISPYVPFGHEYFVDLFNTSFSETLYNPGDYLEIQLYSNHNLFNGNPVPPGIYGQVGNGASWLTSNVEYSYNFVPYTWYNLIETFNTTSWKMYLDGNKVASGSYSGTPKLINSNPSSVIGIGTTDGLGGFGNFCMDSQLQIADVQVYNSMLTQNQAMQLYAQGIPPHYNMNISLG